MTVLVIGHVLGDAEMLDLGVVEHLVDRVDRAAGHAGGVELADPGLGGFLLRELSDRGVEGVTIRRAGGRCGVVGIGVSSGAPIAWAKRSQIRPPVVAILI